MATGIKDSPDWEERLLYYKNNVTDLDCKEDHHYEVRAFYYKVNGVDADCKIDSHKNVRKLFYLANPHDIEALNDICYSIWSLYLSRHPTNLLPLKLSTNEFVRAEYYYKHPFDDDWKQDPHPLTRTLVNELKTGVSV